MGATLGRMTLHLELPDDIAHALGTPGDLARRALELLALEELRAGRLNRRQLRRMLGFNSHEDFKTFLKVHSVYREHPAEEFERDLEAVQEWLTACG